MRKKTVKKKAVRKKPMPRKRISIRKKRRNPCDDELLNLFESFNHCEAEGIYTIDLGVDVLRSVKLLEKCVALDYISRKTGELIYYYHVFTKYESDDKKIEKLLAKGDKASIKKINDLTRSISIYFLPDLGGILLLPDTAEDRIEISKRGIH